MKNHTKPWVSGPQELLDHAKEHLETGSGFDLRISFISIDNAVELIIKTYLGLPKRIRKSDVPPRKKLADASGSFPDLLDLLEEYGADKLEGIDLGDIEWYHRIRNTLYHDGNGVTVGKEKVDSYIQIAVILYNSLFDENFDKEKSLKPESVLGEIVLHTAQLEHNLGILYRHHFPEETNKKIPLRKSVLKLAEKGVLPEQLKDEIIEATAIRNEAVHSTGKIDLEKVKKAADFLMDIVIKVATNSIGIP